jgi:UDP-3-O-acyl N-acetylglucosamine deacetylase
MVVKPAPENTGVIFRRVDLATSPTVSATLPNLDSKPRRTGLRTTGSDARIDTVEHFLACLFVLGVDNLVAELNAEELPCFDGSAVEFYRLLTDAGVSDQSAPARTLAISERILVSDGQGEIVALPESKGLWISYELSYGEPVNLTQSVEIEITEEIFAREIAPARTFCTEAEVDSVIASGLGKGATRENTIILGSGGKFSTELRFPDECARHKILDLLGDLFFVGGALTGKLKCSRSGHSLNRTLVQKILNL